MSFLYNFILILLAVYSDAYRCVSVKAYSVHDPVYYIDYRRQGRTMNN